MSSTVRKTAKLFLADYKTDENFLISPNRDHGRPGLLQARDPEGRQVLVKTWVRNPGTTGSDLEQIWRSEIRQLQRLAAVPRAEDLFVPMLTSGEDAEGFHLVLDPGHGSPLEIFRRAKNPPAAMVQPRLPRNRRRLWANALRAAEALELLHSLGIIHRNIDPWAIVTNFGDQPDFRLTGFEWSMRIAASDSMAAVRKSGGHRDAVASFGRDWTNLGILTAELIGAPLDRVSNLALVPSEIAEHLSAAEGQLLRSMMRLETAERLDGEMICRRMQDLVAAVSAEVSGREAKFAVAFRLGRGSNVADGIRRASDYEIEISDMRAQLEFVAADLSSEPFFARIAGRDEAEPTFALFGQYLTYHLSGYRQPGSEQAADWEFALCERVDQSRPSAGFILGSHPLEPAAIDLSNDLDAQNSFPRRHGRVAHWDQLIKATEPKISKKTDLDRMHQAFSLLLVLEMAYAAADIFPVEVTRRAEKSKSGDSYTLTVTSRYDAGRAALSDAVGLEAPAVRLTKMLESDDLQQEGSWTLTETGALGDRTHETEWRFVGGSEKSEREVLRFEGSATADAASIAYLAPPGLGGQLAQFKRRRRALKVLREHTELLRMFVDPRFRIEDSHDPLDDKEERFKQLDDSKKAALSEILSTIPLFFLQGPPGVGKTYLVGDIVRRRFEDDPTTRMLLSAQSNAAIDHLMKEVQSVFEGQGLEGPVMVRARPAEDDPADTDLEIDRQADRHLEALAASRLVEETDPGLRAMVLSLVEDRKRSARSRRMASEGRAFEGMILRAANLVFATTNSAAVDRLIEERSLFDWSIVEEAGKATGGELLSPLLLSHRRLMIGDHKQLPPYNADRMKKLLSLPEKVRAAVTSAEEYISRYLRDFGLDELFDDVEADQDDFGRLCSDTLSILTLFESMVEAEFARKTRRTPLRPIARRLEEQHRMHPAIARIVSTCFYEGKLRTNPKKEEEYLTLPPPVGSKYADSFPDTPIVFIDMPYVRAERGYRGGDRFPRWSNVDEAQAAVQALSLLRVVGENNPSLAVLSPYREQVKLLKEKINASLGGPLSHLSGFKSAVGEGEYCGTVDSFQGDQADVVLVSLVRNNGHATPEKALGFLTDDRRMNVLLSRAKWKMIVVGSLSFYRSVVELSAGLPEAKLGFLKNFIVALSKAEKDGDATILPWSRLAGRPA